MKNDHSCQAGNGAKPASATDGNATGFTRMRSKLAFDRLVEMGARMGMENPLFLCHERAAKATTLINGREYLNFSTYDYLDINAHPEITEAVTKAAALYGTSAGASRLVGGERPPHRELERALAELYGVEDCIVYVSGHATNVSTLGFLFGHRDAIFHDGLAHNSLVQGARLSGATRYSYAHNDCDALEELLRNKRAEHKRAIIVTEGLFSMDGNIPDLPRIIALKKKYDCMLLVDEAHSLGVLGATGRGAREYFNIDPTDVDMWMSTLSKSMCGCGGFIAGSHELVEFLKYGSPGFVFSVGMPPVIAVACRKALEIMLREPERVRNLQRISQFFIRYAAEIGLDTGAAQGYAVVPVMVGDPMVAGFLSNALFKRGVYVMPITFPAVKEGTDRLRFFLSAAHTEDHIRRALDAVREAMPEARAIVDEYKRTHADAAEGD
ncbi:aminotransferase class I/II-fold pyridoxal phosphate-dependent enzyme [Desulfovibrio legallii]|jgi:8-amino-7-oxononanoate synthase|uniref:Aminotransferase class I/II-fold pyridoxal phosphate-dependent enzyme n=1 Tax=Desulfovibrio legallii TaxID=571438 RepID=A0A6H3FCW1_9BACT|nr:aminotransferase class I/II-fold pyridoxal phosphate-dependent enzyme [Desulfovibrio legallii]RHH21799.1 aminotransferase class I/II-fold pyridoxal phosphate-dependent enzyme [Desulfovibrio sp. AM18-2]TBH78977.1 aminotransferase class I/II-fold pyridoxal phosphate-dependent enzyme [Desulfovibrio legallii]CAI3242442.1 Pyridoxal phosphate (PLP)-dependent aspartate aminotransferase [Desulfovibrio diazotrophicus]